MPQKRDVDSFRFMGGIASNAGFVETGGTMLARLASVYVRCLLAVQLLLLGLSILLHVGALLSADRIFAEYGKYLYYCALVVSVAGISLAEEKNVWKNEFRRCPQWLRAATLTLMVYGMVVASAQVALSNHGSFEDQPLFASGASLFFESMPLCILYSLLWAGPSPASDLVKRVRISIITLAICLAIVVAVQLGYMPHRLVGRWPDQQLSAPVHGI